MPYRPSQEIADALIAERFEIRATIANAVDASFSAATRAFSGNAGEVEKLIYFFMEGLPILETGLNRLLRRHHVSVVVSGVFCHQTPKVRSAAPCSPSGSCELGDIAFIATYADLPAVDGFGNAVLMQAKSDFHPGVAADQEILYESADSFQYVSPTSLASQRRSLRGAHGCLYYWDFGHRYQPLLWHTAHTTCAVLARPRRSGAHFVERFENMLADMFCGTAGRGFTKTPSGNGWTQIIHDIVENAATRAINHRRIFSPRHGSRPSRLYNYAGALRSDSRTSLVRCSLSEFLEAFGSSVKAAGRQLEEEASNFTWETGEKNNPSGKDGGDDLPPLGRGDESDAGSGGGSFVVFQFKSEKNS